MANPYFDFTSSANRFISRQKARADHVNLVFDQVTTGFDSVDTDITAVENEVSAAREGKTDLVTNLQAKVTWTLTQNIDGTGVYSLVNIPDPVNNGDAANKSWVLSVVSSGGDPSNTPITSLGVGTATADQFIRINSAGSAVIGSSQSAVGVTGFGVGSMSATQLLRANSAGTALEGVSVSGINVTDLNPGSASAGQVLAVNSAGTAIIGQATENRLNRHFFSNS